MSDVCAPIFAGLILVGVFVLGMLFMRTIIRDEERIDRYNRMRQEYYTLAGVKNSSDPLPYVPPIKKRYPLPYIHSLERMLRQGKRGTVMWRAGDRQKYMEMM